MSGKKENKQNMLQDVSPMYNPIGQEGHRGSAHKHPDSQADP